MKQLLWKLVPTPLKELYRRQKYRTGEDHRLEAMVGPPGVWQESRNFQIDFLCTRGLQPWHTLLDIGCGPLRGGIPLIAYLDTGNYTGIDIRPDIIKEAKIQVRKSKLNHKKPTVVASSTFGEQELGVMTYDYIWCFQVLYHLDDDIAKACLCRISSLLSDGGVCFANVNVKHEEGHWLEFPYIRRSLEFYEAIALKHGLTTNNLGEQRDWGYTTKVAGQYDTLLEFRTMG
jgi:2-polyprenyl-3-methyl-5-hydroxy-6-metoxy-1,4-benzoquinol methylase